MIAKELRALAPMWAAVAATIAGAAVFDDSRMTILALFAFAVGSVAIGAHSIGHEYTHRTLPVLLALPCDRRRLLLAKMSSLAPAVLGLAGLAWLTLFRHPELLRAAKWHDFPAPAVLPLCALFVAPWLTMLCRSTLGGVAFTVVIPPILVIAGELVGRAMYGPDAASRIDALKFSLVWWGTLALAPCAAVAGWRTFMRLEALEGSGREFQLPRWHVGTRHARRGHPILALVSKELRLQQLSFVLFGILAAMWAVFWAMQRFAARATDVFDMLLTLSMALLAVVIGSLACAEERQLGTHDAQLLLPVPVWKQWTVKAGVALGVAFALGVTIPMLAAAMLGKHDVAPAVPWRSLAMTVAVLTTISLYVSSVSSSGVRAAVMTLPALLGLGLVVQTTMATLGRPEYLYFEPVARMSVKTRFEVLRMVGVAGPLALAGLLIALLLWFGFRNYRSGERGVGRVAVQVLGAAAVVALILTLEHLTFAVFYPLPPHP